jgi:hypothetical protein
MAGTEQANLKIFSETLFKSFRHRCRIQWPGEAAYGRVPDRRREGSRQAEKIDRTWLWLCNWRTQSKRCRSKQHQILEKMKFSGTCTVSTNTQIVITDRAMGAHDLW